MLNPDALQKLAELKRSIEAAKNYAEGVVRGTQGRFGFVVLDDGREAFLPPETMQQVLPGDRIKVSLVENNKQKLEARLEKLLHSELLEFVGRYVEKGANHFIVADHPQISRWLFVPPKARRQNAHGDLVVAKLSRHPFGDGRAQARVVKRIGKHDDVGIERKYTIAKFSLPTDWPEAALQQSRELAATDIESKTVGRTDLRHLPFVTVDAESTQDMDDALYGERLGDHTWKLITAIADVAAWVAPQSPLDNAARERATSVYFPDSTLPMFPTELSHEHLSLVPGKDRLALVCSITIDGSGTINDFEFTEAVIRSREKLSYSQVNDVLKETEAANDVAGELHPVLHALTAIATHRREFRSSQSLVQEDSADYYYILNKHQKIERIEKKIPTPAHRLVEEAMLATNVCAGQFLAESRARALFSTHRGFRRERIGDVKQLVAEFNSELATGDFEQLSHFVPCLRQVANRAPPRTLATLRRLMQAGELSYQCEPHFGLGFASYALATSPIRRYQDLYNHRAIKAHLAKIDSFNKESSNQKSGGREAELPARLQQRIINSRAACRALEQWLACDYLQQFVNQEFDALVSAVSNQGLGIRLLDNGIESFISIRGSKEKPTHFDSVRMVLTANGTGFELEQAVRVKLIRADMEKRQLHFEIL